AALQTFEVQNSTNLNQTTALHLFTTTITETQFPATALATEIITSTATETIMLTTFVAETIYVTETAAPRNQPIHASFLPEGSSPPSNKILNMIIEQDLLLNNLHSPLFDPSTGSQGVSGFGDTPRHFAHGFDIFNITVRGNVIISGSNSDCEISAHEANEMIPEATCSDKLLEILEMDGCEINWIERFLVWSLHLGLLSTKFLVVCVVAFSFIAGGT
ncbi:hypothetical protein RUND412_008847, partial [Rhizina undulata]